MARSRVVWEIGQVVSERLPFDPPPEHAATFAVGRSDPREWEPVHRGPLDATAGFSSVTRTITFDVDDAEGGHELVIEVLAGFVPTPDLDVDVNGHTGRYSVSPPPGSRLRTVRVPLADGVVRPGHNVAKLTTVSEGPKEDERGHARPRGGIGSGIAYRRVALERGLPDVCRPSLDVDPLPLYRSTPGGVVELVDVTLTAPNGFERATGTLRIGEAVVPLSFIADGRRHGEFRVRVEVPELVAPSHARVDVDVDGGPVAADLEFHPARKWTIHVIPQVHLDVGFTDFQAKTLEVHVRNIDRALSLLDRHPEYRFGIDGALVVRDYLSSRSPAMSQRLVRALRSEQIGLQAFSMLFLTGVASLEECYRAAAIAQQLRRDHDVPVRYANLTDVPSYSGAVPSILTDLGVDGFMGMMNHARARTASTDEIHERSPFWWEGPDGARVLTSFVEGYIQLRSVAGNPPTVAGAADGLSRLCRAYDRDDYAPSDLPVAGSHADNLDLGDGEATLADRWNEAYAWPRLRFSTIAQYLDAVRPLGDRLPVLRGDGGSFWEDGVGAAAGPVARYRDAQGLLMAAEAAAALVAAADPALSAPRADLDRAWEELLYGCEHTWTWAHCLFGASSEQTVDQLAWKVQRIETAHRMATDELRRGLSRLGELVTTPGPSVIAFNPCSWERDDDVEIELAPTDAPTAHDGTTIDAEVVADLGATRRLRLRTGRLPPLGYRVFPIVKGSAVTAPDIVPAPPVIETDRYRLEIDADARVRSLRHLPSDRELVDATSEHALGEVLYVAGGGTAVARGLGREQTTLTQSIPSLPPPVLDIGRAAMRVVGLRRGPLGLTVVAEGTATSIPRIRSELRLRDDDDRVDLLLRLDKEHVLAKESVYVAFPFAFARPTMRYDRQHGWVDPAADHLPGACNEWFTTQFGVGLQDDGGALVWTSASAPLFAVGDVVRGLWPETFETPRRGTILSWVMNNYWFTNFPASQGGTIDVRYAFRPMPRWDPAAAARFGREVRMPVACGEVTYWEKDDHGPRSLPTDGRSLLETDASDGVVTSVFGASVPGGMVVRLQDVSGDATTVRLRHPAGSAGRARLCSAIEEPGAELSVDGGTVTVDVRPWGVTSILLEPAD
ncbi:MAG: hypothetical protein L0206_03425 [Actinobacteria bacterium]|nr:hypothetical protein [Actinomycetota bacterium]